MQLREPNDGAGSDSSAAQLLSDCWLNALGYRPSAANETLELHQAGYKERQSLAFHVRQAFGCCLGPRFFRGEVPFQKTAAILEPLVSQKTESGPVIYLAPGRGGVSLSELLIAKSYPGPGVFHLLRYPSFSRMVQSRQLVDDLVTAIIDQLPAAEDKTPLLLAGHSLGAHLMLQAACRLASDGRAIAGVFLIRSIAFPERVHLRCLDRRLYECRNIRDVAESLLWTVSVPHRPAMLVLSQVLSILKRAGFPHLADAIQISLAGRIQVKSMLAYRQARYPGDICLIRALKSTPTAAEDERWSELCSGVQISPFPVPVGELLRAANLANVLRELGHLVEQRVGLYAPHDRSPHSQP